MADGSFPFFENRERTAWLPVHERVIGTGKAGTEPHWWLNVQDSPYTPEEMHKKLIRAEITYDAEGGAAMRMTLQGRATGMDGLIVSMRAGYGASGDGDRIFRGRIMGVSDDAFTAYSEVLAYGTAVVRGRERINEGLDFSNLTLREAMFYINRKAAEFGEWGVYGGEDYVIHDPNDSAGTEAETNQPGFGVFGSETTWTEVERSLLENTPYISYDNPWGHIVTREPELRRGGDPVNYTWWWQPVITISDYEKDAFTFTAGTREIYNRVIAFRKTQDYGEYVTVDQGPGEPKRVREFYQVYAEAQVNRVGRYAMPEGTDDVIPDFAGKQGEAEREVARRAIMYETVRGDFELSGRLRGWWPMDVFYIERIERAPGGRLSFITGVPLPAGDPAYVRALYTCLVNGGVQQTIGKMAYDSTVRGKAALHSLAPATDPSTIPIGATSGGVGGTIGQTGGGGSSSAGAPFPIASFPGRLHIEGGVAYFDWSVAPTQVGMTPQDAINLLSATFADPNGWARAGIHFRYNPAASVAEYEWMVESECAALIGAGGGGCTLCGATCRVTFFQNATDMGTINHETGHAMFGGHPAFANGSIMWGGGNGTPYPSDADIDYVVSWLAAGGVV